MSAGIVDCDDAGHGDDSRVLVLITKPSGQVVEFARRNTRKQAEHDVAGLRYWGIDARLELPESSR